MTRKFRDDADWNGVDLVSTKVGAGGIHRDDYAQLVHDGYVYASREERMLAELFNAHGIPFVPDVAFDLGRIGRSDRKFVPDFIFDDHPYVWSGRPLGAARGRHSVLIHGIEAKGTDSNGEFSARARENVARLWQLRRIRVLLLSNDDIRHYHSVGNLPMRRFSG